ncbi:MAG: magnesium/cobalt transporter CorA [Bacteroidota bacterium]|nr:MAG: magnesium/cobalt transporter CorA [Bacteroidota bacterium]
MNPFGPIKKLQPLHRKKPDPSVFIFTGSKRPEKISIQLFQYNKENCKEKQNLVSSDIENFSRSEYRNWLNIHGLSEPNSIVDICQKFDIHNLVIQDILDVNQRPKFQEFDDFSFLTIKSIVPSDSEIITEQISFILGENFLISFQERKADFFEHLRYRLRNDTGILRQSATDYLLYTMLESILDNYFKTLNKIDSEIDSFNFTDTKKEPSPDTLKLIENHKKFVHFIKKSIFPIKEFTLQLEREEKQFIDKKNIKYFLEIKDLCLTLLDSCDMIQASLESNTNLFFSVQGYRMNQLISTLTIVSTIFIPLTFIAGIYGMNFANMPELKWKYGYAAAWLLMGSTFTAMVFYLRKKGGFNRSNF